MEKPKCRVCNHRHWSNEDHTFSEEVQSETKPAPRVSEGVVAANTDSQKVPSKITDHIDSGDASVPHKKADTGQVARNQRWREKNREKYNAYMREYRRKK